MKTYQSPCGEVIAHGDWLSRGCNDKDYFRLDAAFGDLPAVAVDCHPWSGWQIWCGENWADVDEVRARVLLLEGPRFAQEWVNSRYTKEGAPR